MLNIDINGEKYKVPENWGDVTISKAAEVFEICADMPPLLMDLYKAYGIQNEELRKETIDTAQKAITDKETIKTFPTFYGKIIQSFSGIPDDVLEEILWPDRTAFYDLHLRSFIIGLLFHPVDFTPQNITEFEWQDETFLLPETKIIIGDARVFAETHTAQFTESADLELHSRTMAGGKFQVAANIVSILCIPEGEKYDEKRSLKRAETMKDLSMDIFYEVFFCLAERLKNLKVDTLTYLAAEASKQKPRRKRRALSRSAGLVASSR